MYFGRRKFIRFNAMNEERVVITYKYYQNLSEIPTEDQELLARAKGALLGSYAPYSQFKVGCALRLEDGTIVQGSNQENVAYPSGLCAERVAIFWAGSNHPGKKIVAIAITAASEIIKTDHPITPCGSCRQSMLEYELNQETPIKVIMQGSSGRIMEVESISCLLPFYFNEVDLKH